MDSIKEQAGGFGKTALATFNDPFTLGKAQKFAGGLSDAAGFSLEANSLAQKGIDTEAMKNFSASQIRGNMGLVRALAQRDMIQHSDAGEELESDAVARAAASMGGIDPGVERIIGNIAAETQLRKHNAIAGGELKNIQLENTARMRESEGAYARAAGARASKAKKRSSLNSVLGSMEHLSFLKKFGEPAADGPYGAWGGNSAYDFGNY